MREKTKKRKVRKWEGEIGFVGVGVPNPLGRGDRAAAIMDSIVVCQVVDVILVELADFVSDTSDFASDTSDFVSDF